MFNAFAVLSGSARELTSSSTPQFSGNPIFANFRTADPSPIVGHDGRLYVYTSGDQPRAENYDSMDHYRCYSTDNMVDWTYHGVMLSALNLSWRNPKGGRMFAPDIAYKNDKYYLYFPHNIGKGKGYGWRIGVATSDSPTGPFVDSGQPMKGPEDNATGMRAFDPCCFIDDDGTAYLYWGFGKPPTSYAYVARLKDNMVELAEEPRQVDIGAENYREGPFVHKREGKYYFSYKNWPEDSAARYAIGDSPYGPFVNHGLLARSPGAPAHPGIIEYHGKWYYFYHRGDYTMDGIPGSHTRRAVCVDEMHYNPDGTIQEVKLTQKGVRKNGKTHLQSTQTMARVLIIGDSISMGYTAETRRNLADVAHVFRPSENCGSTVVGLKNLDKWLGDEKWDIIHFNFGLHDVKYGTDAQASGHHNVPPDEYERNLELIVTQLRKTGAALIFATTTPIPEGIPRWVNGDSAEYNKIALRVMHRHGIEINDLYADSLDAITRWQIPQNVHFTVVGSRELAGIVSASIRKVLMKDEATTMPSDPLEMYNAEE